MNKDNPHVRSAAEEVIETIDRNLKKWCLWFPSEESIVDVRRVDLLALKHYAEIGLDATKRSKGMQRIATAALIVTGILTWTAGTLWLVAAAWAVVTKGGVDGGY